MSDEDTLLTGTKKEEAYADTIDFIKDLIEDGKMSVSQGTAFLHTARDNKAIANFVRGAFNAVAVTEPETWIKAWANKDNRGLPKILAEIATPDMMEQSTLNGFKGTLYRTIQSAMQRNTMLDDMTDSIHPFATVGECRHPDHIENLAYIPINHMPTDTRIEYNILVDKPHVTAKEIDELYHDYFYKREVLSLHLPRNAYLCKFQDIIDPFYICENCAEVESDIEKIIVESDKDLTWTPNDKDWYPGVRPDEEDVPELAR